MNTLNQAGCAVPQSLAPIQAQKSGHETLLGTLEEELVALEQKFSHVLKPNYPAVATPDNAKAAESTNSGLHDWFSHQASRLYNVIEHIRSMNVRAEL